eukprot:jgi/Ulvmu1/5526/UM023_0062.1
MRYSTHTAGLLWSSLCIALLACVESQRPSLDHAECGKMPVQQISESYLPEGSCLAWTHVPDTEADSSIKHRGMEEGRDAAQALAVVEHAADDSEHKSLFPLSVKDVVGWILACVTLFIAAGGGIGGGGALVPIYIILWNFKPAHAVALSNLTITGGALANLYCNYPRKHPTAERPLVYWDMILVMEPMTIVGAVAGGFFTKLLPPWMTTFMLCGLLFFLSNKLWRKTIGMWNRESAAQALARTQAPSIPASIQEDLDPDCEVHVMTPLLEDSSKAIVAGLLSDDPIEALPSEECVAAPGTIRAPRRVSLDDAAAAAGLPPTPPFNGHRGSASAALLREARAILLHERKHLPLPTLITLLALFVWLSFTDIMKGYAPCGGLLYWALVLSIVPIVALTMGIVRRVLIHNCRVKQQVGIVPEVGDVMWTESSTIVYPLVCSIAGVFAGMFGVGGGIVKGPLMLHLGVLPEVAASTSATMILFTSSSASIVYITFGGIKWDYASLMVFTGFFFTLAGQIATYRVIALTGRKSVIVAAMSILVSVGGIIIIAQMWPLLASAYHRGFLRHAPICD